MEANTVCSSDFVFSWWITVAALIFDLHFLSCFSDCNNLLHTLYMPGQSMSRPLWRLYSRDPLSEKPAHLANAIVVSKTYCQDYTTHDIYGEGKRTVYNLSLHALHICLWRPFFACEICCLPAKIHWSPPHLLSAVCSSGTSHLNE